MNDEGHDEGYKPGTTQDKPWWAEVVKEVTSVGLGTFFMTEEAVRSYIKEKKLPKELISALLDGVAKKKEDFSSMLSKELARWLSKVDISRELDRFFETHRVKLDASLTFEPRKTQSTEKKGNDNE